MNIACLEACLMILTASLQAEEGIPGRWVVEGLGEEERL